MCRRNSFPRLARERDVFKPEVQAKEFLRLHFRLNEIASWPTQTENLTVDDEVVALVSIAGLYLFLSTWVIVAYAAYAWRTWQDAKVKRDMIGRGYTAGEIIAVVRSNRQSKREEQLLPDVPPAKPVRQPAYG